jgi:hypothetical protein
MPFVIDSLPAGGNKTVASVAFGATFTLKNQDRLVSAFVVSNAGNQSFVVSEALLNFLDSTITPNTTLLIERGNQEEIKSVSMH